MQDEEENVVDLEETKAVSMKVVSKETPLPFALIDPKLISDLPLCGHRISDASVQSDITLGTFKTRGLVIYMGEVHTSIHLIWHLPWPDSAKSVTHFLFCCCLVKKY